MMALHDYCIYFFGLYIISSSKFNHKGYWNLEETLSLTHSNFDSKPSHPCTRVCSWMTFLFGLALLAPATVRWTFLCSWDRRPQPSNNSSLSRQSDLIAYSLP